MRKKVLSHVRNLNLDSIRKKSKKIRSTMRENIYFYKIDSFFVVCDFICIDIFSNFIYRYIDIEKNSRISIESD